MDKFEQGKFLGYLANLLGSKEFVRERFFKIFEWHLEHGRKFVPYNWNLQTIGIADSEVSLFDVDDLSKEEKKHILKQVPLFRQKISEKSYFALRAQKSNMEICLLNLQKILGLGVEEKESLGLMVRYSMDADMKDVFDDIFRCGFLKAEYVKEMTGFSKDAVDRILGYESKIIKNGLIEVDYDGDISLTKFCQKIFIQKLTTQKALYRFVLGEELSANLKWDDFGHIADKDFCWRLLKNAFAAKETGINILLYGEPGTGKTEFAKTLCEKAEVPLYALGERMEEDNRRKYLELSQQIVRPGENVCLLIDEADDVFLEKKIIVNRMLENNNVPRIWIINCIEGLDKAYLRRFSFIMHFKKPDLQVRAKIWQKAFRDGKIKVTAKTAEEFAQIYSLPPSFIVAAVRSVKLAGGGLTEIRNCLNSLEQAYTDEEKTVHTSKNTDFNPALLNTDTDLELLAGRLSNLKKTNFSLCLYGASGTGKSAYAEYLAKRLGLNVIKKQCSDLISKFVGETERNIALAFREALENGAMLVFDEADSFLGDRGAAVRSYEVTQVNEMLVQMENFPFPFVCTTNLMDKLDKACLRRFTFKVRYEFMTEEQVKKAFYFFFKKKVTNCGSLARVTPGDFAVVKNKAEILGLSGNVKELVKMLEQEQSVKDLDSESTRRLGFV